MKHLGKFIVLFFIFTSIHAATYTLDPSHTYVQFHINHFGYSNPSGKWYANGTLEYDKPHPQQAKVNTTIQVANIVTGIPELDDHLKGPGFFDVAKYPTATFVSDKVKLTGPNTANVSGMLTLHGVSKPVVLKVTFNKLGKSVLNDKMTVGFSATAQLKRSDFGMTQFLPGLSDEVKLDIEAEGYIPDNTQQNKQ